MTRGAIFRRGLVEKHRLFRNYPGCFMATPAAHVLMRATQRERRPLLVIKQRRFPPCAVVTLGAASHVRFGELPAVDVLMAVLALRRRGLEIYIEQPGFEIRRLMAIDAGCHSMRTQQGKPRFRVVESSNFFPRFGCVAGLASRRRTVGSHLLHAFPELPLMRVVVATSACQVFPVIHDGWLRLEIRRFLVAV